MDIAGHITKTVSAKGFLVFCGLLSGMITARWLGPDDRGLLAIISSIPATVWVLINMGTNQASIYYINKGTHKLKTIAANCFIIPLCLGPLIVTLAWITREFIILKYLPFLNPFLLAVALLPIPFLILQDSFTGILRVTDKFDILNLRQVLRAIIGLCIVVGILVIFKAGLETLIIFLVALDCILSVWIIKETLKICTIKISEISCKVLGDLFKFGSKSYIQNAIGYLHNRVDMYMIGYFLSSSQIAFYDIAVIIGELLLFLPQAVTFVLLSKFVRDSNTEKYDPNTKLLRVSFLLTTIFAVFLFCTGYWLILFVYGAEYLPAYNILIILLPGLIISSFNGITIPFFTSRNWQRITIICSISSLALNIILNFIFIPRFGAIGAAGVTTFTYSFFSLSLLVVYRKKNMFRYSNILIPKKEDIMQLREIVIMALNKIRNY